MVAHPSRRLARASHAVAVAVLAAAAIGCGSSDGSTDDATSTASRPAGSVGSAVAAVPAVPAAFDVQAPLVGGGQIDLTERAASPLVLWFWAPY